MAPSSNCRTGRNPPAELSRVLPRHAIDPARQRVRFVRRSPAPRFLAHINQLSGSRRHGWSWEFVAGDCLQGNMLVIHGVVGIYSPAIAATLGATARRVDNDLVRMEPFSSVPAEPRLLEKVQYRSRARRYLLHPQSRAKRAMLVVVV